MSSFSPILMSTRARLSSYADLRDLVLVDPSTKLLGFFVCHREEAIRRRIDDLDIRIAPSNALMPSMPSPKCLLYFILNAPTG